MDNERDLGYEFSRFEELQSEVEKEWLALQSYCDDEEALDRAIRVLFEEKVEEILDAEFFNIELHERHFFDFEENCEKLIDDLSKMYKRIDIYRDCAMSFLQEEK